MWQLKVYFIFVLGFFMNGVAGRILPEGDNRIIGSVLPEVNNRIVGSILPEETRRIVGGNEVDITDYPYQVSVLLLLKHYQCGGSIISEKYVLTAAHCILFRPHVYKIRAGSPFWDDGGELYDVESLTPHPKYGTYPKHDLNYDVALIKISGTFDINSVTTKIVKLADASSKLATRDSLTLTGWGRTATGGPQSKILKAAVLPVVDHDQCIDLWKDKSPITENMLCAGYLKNFQSSCDGDSGGPLVDEDMVQHGVLSFGDEICEHRDFPNVFISVASLRSWIKKISGV